MQRERDKLARAIAFVGVHRPATPALPRLPLVQQHGSHVALGSTIRGPGHRIDDQAVPVLDHQVAHKGQDFRFYG
jgi:hypothetical protein